MTFNSNLRVFTIPWDSVLGSKVPSGHCAHIDDIESNWCARSLDRRGLSRYQAGRKV